MSNLKKVFLSFMVACFMAAFAGSGMAQDATATVKEGMKMLKERLAT